MHAPYKHCRECHSILNKHILHVYLTKASFLISLWRLSWATPSYTWRFLPSCCSLRLVMYKRNSSSTVACTEYAQERAAAENPRGAAYHLQFFQISSIWALFSCLLGFDTSLQQITGEGFLMGIEYSVLSSWWILFHGPQLHSSNLLNIHKDLFQSSSF